ncbi:MAG: cation:proton antiporter, partial [Gemmatimonadales bacterium]|nr:cation:proton antiporter [Gemmatimonadales bacterium]
VGAKLGGTLFDLLKLPAVLGELTAGILLGNLGLVGFSGLEALKDSVVLQALAQIGVLFLLFEVGLHSDLKSMMAVGASAFLAAVLGVVAPMVLGYFCSQWFFPGHNPLTHWFVGATLCATSVGITARVLSDLHHTNSSEGRIILGAAVIDDVLGLIVLAVVAGIIKAADMGQAFDLTTVAVIVGKAFGFLAAAIVVGRWLSGLVFKVGERLTGEGILLSLALGFCFFIAFLAGKVGLAPIVGAFAAGLVLEEVHYKGLQEREGHSMRELLHPLATFLVPVFFVLMGMSVDLKVFGNMNVIGFAAALTVAAIVGKQACSLGVLDKKADRLAVGLGMIPRGEVGLIFASIGATLTIAGERVVDDTVFSAVVIMVVITTMVTPPLLVARLKNVSPD